MVGLVLAAAVSLAWCLVAIRIGPRVGLVDRPDDPDLKAHDHPAIPLGGVGIFVGAHAALSVSGAFDVGLFAATAVVLVLGVIDDLRDLPPALRLAVEVVAGGVLVVLARTPLAASSAVDLAVGVGLVVLVINAVNLFDGLDGLVGASATVAALTLAGLAGWRGADATFGLVLVGALGGFLVINWHPARVFLGDNGAYTVGVFLTYAVLVASPEGLGTRMGIALLALGVFAIDLAATVIRRKLANRPLFTGDRSHIYDQLRDRGMSVPAIALVSAAAQALFSVVALGLEAVEPGIWIWFVLAGSAAAVLAALAATGFLRPGESSLRVTER